MSKFLAKDQPKPVPSETQDTKNILTEKKRETPTLRGVAVKEKTVKQKNKSLKEIRDQSLDLGESLHDYQLRTSRKRAELARLAVEAESLEGNAAWNKLNRMNAEVASGDRDGDPLIGDQWDAYKNG